MRRRSGRESYGAVADVDAFVARARHGYAPGGRIPHAAYEYHETRARGIVVTLMQKHGEGTIHANSVAVAGPIFTTTSTASNSRLTKLFAYVVAALGSREIVAARETAGAGE